MSETAQGTEGEPPPYNEVADSPKNVPQSNDDCCTRGVKMYVSFSFFRFILRRLGRIQKAEDPELDIEHHLPFSDRRIRRASMVQIDNKRVRCYRCCIVLLIFLWLSLICGVSVAMVLTGVFQTSSCPFDNNFIIIYLIISGIMTILVLLLRLLLCSCQVCVSCYKNRLPGTGFAFSVCSVELLTCIFLLFLICWLGAGVYFTFGRSPNVNGSQLDPTLDNFCSESVYIPAYIFVLLQLVLIPWTVVTFVIICLGAKWCCCLNSEEGVDGAPRRTCTADTADESTNGNGQ